MKIFKNLLMLTVLTLFTTSAFASLPHKSKVSSNDSTPGYLNGKLIEGTNVTLVENNDGDNETLTVNASATATGITLDLTDDGSDESTALSEIATSGDTNSIFTEPTADKLLIDASNAWPTADALAANGANCTAGKGAGGVDASGVAEDCTDYIDETDLDSEAELEAQLIGVTDVYTNNDTIPVANGGTNLTSATDDTVMTGNGTTWQAKTIPDCNSSTDKIAYTQSTNGNSSL